MGHGSLEMNASRTILVVDDEDPLRRLMARVIERAGTQALTAATSSEARDCFREHLDEIDVVLLDVMMPDGGGAATLLPEFLAQRPGLDVILTSGDALPRELETQLEQVGGQFLRKPFVPGALLRILESSSSSTSPSTSSTAREPGGPL